MPDAETIRIIHLRTPDHVLGVIAYPGSKSQVRLPLRSILADILNLGSTALILTHNHPLGDPTPSPADISSTLQLAGVLNAIDVRLHDHIVIGQAGRISFREAGLL